MRRVQQHTNDWLDRLPQRTLAGLGMAGVLGVLGVVCAAPARADDHAAIDSTKIIGNRELPKVLYIVPWKKPLPGELSGRPLDSVLDEALAPLDRDVFRRQVHYDAQIEAQAPAGAAPPDGAVPGAK